jgi:hypothetical protein
VRHNIVPASLFECFISLCLSRACLGQIIVFSTQMAQKDAFSYLSGVDPSVRPIYVAGWRTGADPITTFVIIFSPFC